LANVLLIEAMAHHEIGKCATIYRLNLAPAAIFAFVFLGEPVTIFKLLGIGAAVIGVVLLYESKVDIQNKKSSSTGLLIFIAVFLRALMGISYKHGLSLGADTFVILTLTGVAWAVTGLIYMLGFEKHKSSMDNKGLSYGLLSGILVSGIVLFMILALEKGQASIVLPVAQLSFLVTCIMGVIWLQESMTVKKIAGLTMAMVCIIFMVLS
jgi:uncharacterized membrane protein